MKDARERTWQDLVDTGIYFGCPVWITTKCAGTSSGPVWITGGVS